LYGNFYRFYIQKYDHVPQILVSCKREIHFGDGRNTYGRSSQSFCRAKENDITITNAVHNLNHPFNKVFEISHVPLNKVSSIKQSGTANLPGESRFYCSNYSTVAWVEY
jgi:hypothetical protein